MSSPTNPSKNMQAQRCLHTSLTFQASVFLSQLHKHTQMHEGSWLSGGIASQADSDVCAGVRRRCSSKRSQEKYDEASLRMLRVCSEARVCGRARRSAACCGFHPRPLSRHNKHFEEYDTLVCRTLMCPIKANVQTVINTTQSNDANIVRQYSV